jgi:DNA-binding NtrC family response regulator
VNSFRASEPDIAAVLLDMTLPGMKSPDVFVELRRIRPDLKIILTTAYSQEMVSANLGGQQPWAFIPEALSNQRACELASGRLSAEQRDERLRRPRRRGWPYFACGRPQIKPKP